MKKKLGLIVNPIAGMGGRVGLKGTDGPAILRKAKELGAEPQAPERAITALKVLLFRKENTVLITYPHEMGENEARECGFSPIVRGSIKTGETTSTDTRNAAREMLRLQVDLLLFAGGDGTARDIYNVIGDKIPALGIPCGVKIHSAVYSTSARNAGELARLYLYDRSSGIHLIEAEVMDIDESSFRENRLSARLYGYLKIPYEEKMVQCAKSGGCAGEQAAIDAIAHDVIKNMEGDHLYIIGTGTTTKALMERLGLRNTLLGVDAVRNKELIGLDLNEPQLLNLIEGRRAKIVVGVIGSQGFIFGRGNQQISARVIRRVGKENIIVLATIEKILTLQGRPLLVDTGDPGVDRMLTGYTQVVTGFGERIILRVES